MPSARIRLGNQAALSVKDLMLDGDQGPQNIRFIGRPSRVTWAAHATAITNELIVRSGERTVVERSQIEGGATDGVFPNMTEKGESFFAAAGEILQFQVRETGNVATTDTMLAISVDPIA